MLGELLRRRAKEDLLHGRVQKLRAEKKRLESDGGAGRVRRMLIRHRPHHRAVAW